MLTAVQRQSSGRIRSGPSPAGSRSMSRCGVSWGRFTSAARAATARRVAAARGRRRAARRSAPFVDGALGWLHRHLTGNETLRLRVRCCFETRWQQRSQRSPRGWRRSLGIALSLCHILRALATAVTPKMETPKRRSPAVIGVYWLGEAWRGLSHLAASPARTACIPFRRTVMETGALVLEICLMWLIDDYETLSWTWLVLNIVVG